MTIESNEPPTNPLFEEPVTVESREIESGIRSRRVEAASSPFSRLNDVFAGMIVVLVLIAPLPVGSNRPIFWMIWACLLGVMCTSYVILASVISSDRHFRSTKHRRIFAFAATVPLFSLVQILPIAHALPDFLTNLPVAEGLQPKTISLAPKATFLGVVRVSSYFLLFFLVIEVATNASRINKIAWALFYGSASYAVWAMISLTALKTAVFLEPSAAFSGVATGPFVNRNSFASFMGMGLVLGLVLILDKSNRPHVRRPKRPDLFSIRNLEAAFHWLCLTFIFVALVSSQSRMGFAASVVAAMTGFFLMRARITHRVGMAALSAFALGAAANVVLFLAFGAGLIERSIFAAQDSVTRLELYRQTIGMVLQRPILGYGLDSYPLAFELFHEPPLSSAVTWEYAHSTYLTFWVELGVVFGTLPLVALGLALLRLARIIRGRRTHYSLAVAAVGFILLAALHTLVDFSFEMEANVFLFLTVIALGIAKLRRGSERKTEL